MNRIISTSSIKLDKPYPIVLINNGLSIMTGTFFVYSEEDSHDYANGKKVVGIKNNVKAYPIVGKADGLSEFVNLHHTVNDIGCASVHQGQTVELKDLYSYCDEEYHNRWMADELKDYMMKWTPRFLKELFKLGCKILPPTEDEITVQLAMFEYDDGTKLVGSPGAYFFSAPAEDIDTAALQLQRIINEYSLLVKKDLKFRFVPTIHEVFHLSQEDKELINKINNRVQEICYNAIKIDK